MNLKKSIVSKKINESIFIIVPYNEVSLRKINCIIILKWIGGGNRIRAIANESLGVNNNIEWQMNHILDSVIIDNKSMYPIVSEPWNESNFNILPLDKNES